MAKILLAISIVITLLTAGLGFMTRSKVDSLQNTISSTKRELDSTKTSLDKTKTDLAKTTQDLGSANKMIEEQKGQITSITTERDEAKRKAEEIAVTVAAKETEIAAMKDQLTKMSATGPDGAGKTPEQVAMEVNQMRDQLSKAQTELAEAKQVQATLNQRVEDQESRLSTANSELRRYQFNIAKAGLNGRVLAVNSGWNFVVLDIGDRQGAAVNAPLLVTRGGQQIARLKITSVEPSTSIADVIPGSLARGTTVQPGDRVVFSGRQAQPAPAQAPTAPQPPLPAPPAGGGAPAGGAGAPEPTL